MLQKMMTFIKENKMIDSGDHVICACSGGADSVCLLLLLNAYRKQFDFSLSAIHVEHGIRGEESLNDQKFVEDLCKRLQIPLYICPVDVLAYAKKKKLGTEEAARILRYEQFRKYGDKAHTKIALAHHMEDQAETILFQMIRGSGLPGLSGISPVRMEESVCYIRPLLHFSRTEIEAFLKLEHQDFCMDASNLDETYSRNKIRNSLLPLLSGLNTQAVLHINSSAKKIEEAYDFILTSTKESYKSLVKEEEECLSIVATDLLQLHPAVKSELVRQMIFKMAGRQKDISAVHVEDVLSLAEKQSGKEVMLPYNLLAYMEHGRLVLCKKKTKTPATDVCFAVTEDILKTCENTSQEQILWQGESGERLLGRLIYTSKPMEEIEKKSYTKQFDYDKIKIGFFVRGRRPGDYFVIGDEQHHKKLSDYLINEKVPAKERDLLLFLAIDSEIIWMIGGRVSESFKVTMQTKRIIEIQYCGGKSDGLFNKT